MQDDRNGLFVKCTQDNGLLVHDIVEETLRADILGENLGGVAVVVSPSRR